MNKVFRRLAAVAAIGLLSGVAVSADVGAITPGTGCGTATGQAFFASSNSTLFQASGPNCHSRAVNRCQTAGGVVQAQGFGSWRTLSQTSTRNCPTGQKIYNWGWQVGS